MERVHIDSFFRGSPALYPPSPHCLPSASGDWRGQDSLPKMEWVSEGQKGLRENEGVVEEGVEAVKNETRVKQLLEREKINRPHQSCRSHAT